MPSGPARARPDPRRQLVLALADVQHVDPASLRSKSAQVDNRDARWSALRCAGQPRRRRRSRQCISQSARCQADRRREPRPAAAIRSGSCARASSRRRRRRPSADLVDLGGARRVLRENFSSSELEDIEHEAVWRRVAWPRWMSMPNKALPRCSKRNGVSVTTGSQMSSCFREAWISWDGYRGRGARGSRPSRDQTVRGSGAAASKRPELARKCLPAARPPRRRGRRGRSESARQRIRTSGGYART